jgi:hypothetical protein
LKIQSGDILIKTNDLEGYVDFFNSKRLQQRLGYKTPAQVEKIYPNGELEQLRLKSAA